jgi:hypothetical protein
MAPRGLLQINPDTQLALCSFVTLLAAQVHVSSAQRCVYDPGSDV